MQAVISAFHTLGGGIGDAFSGVCPLDAVALKLHQLDELFLVSSIFHALINGIHQPHFPAFALDRSMIFRNTHGFGAVIFRFWLANFKAIFHAQPVIELPDGFYLRGADVKFSAGIEGNRVDNKVRVDVVTIGMGTN